MNAVSETGRSRKEEEKETNEPFLSILKKNTHQQHQQLESTRLSRDLMSLDLSRARYVAILYGFYQAFSPLEQALLATRTRQAGDVPISERAPLAAEDIRYLTGSFEAGWSPVAKPLPWTAVTPAVRLGIAYVLEGSRLGGKVISRHIQQVLGVTVDAGGAFFAGNGAPGLESWKEFKKYCAAYAVQHPEEQEEIIRAANEAFRFVEESFTASDSKADF